MARVIDISALPEFIAGVPDKMIAGIVSRILPELAKEIRLSQHQRTKGGQSPKANYSKWSGESAYSPSHRAKRKKASVQTDIKDLWFSGSMWESFDRDSVDVQSDRISMTMKFKGENSKWGKNNQVIANYLSDYEGVNIAEVSDAQ